MCVSQSLKEIVEYCNDEHRSEISEEELLSFCGSPDGTGETDAKAIVELLKKRGITVHDWSDIKKDNLPTGYTYFMNQFTKTKKLTKEESINLGRKIVLGRKCKDVHSEDPIVEEGLRKQEKEGQEARDELILRSTRLVIPIAQRGLKKLHGHGGNIDIDDLIQEGNSGLVHAADKYDPEKGFAFSTYATWWIQQRIQKCLIDANRFSMKDAAVRKQKQIEEFREQFYKENGFPPKIKEISEALNISESEINSFQIFSQDVYNLDQSTDADSDISIVDTIEDENALDDNDIVALVELKEEILKGMRAVLTEEEFNFSVLRWGLDSPYGISRTCIDTARAMGISRHKASTLDATSFRKLQDNTELTQKLRDYINPY